MHKDEPVSIWMITFINLLVAHLRSYTKRCIVCMARIRTKLLFKFLGPLGSEPNYFANFKVDYMISNSFIFMGIWAQKFQGQPF